MMNTNSHELRNTPACRQAGMHTDGGYLWVTILLFLAGSLYLSDSASASIFPHIRNHATFYRVIPQGKEDEELSWLAQHYDLVILDEGLDKYHPIFKSYNQNSKSIVYTNYCNIYKNEPMMWKHFKQWSDQNASDYEAMFLHFKNDHIINWGYGNEGVYDEQFDKVWAYDGSNYIDRSWAAWDSGATFQFLTNTNAMLYLGYSEGKYKEINFNLSSFASGLSIIWEYWNGNSWAPLSVNDGTNSLTRNGNVEFFPPQDWEKTKVNTDEWEYYYIKLRCSSLTTPPTAVTIKAEDFIPYNGTSFHMKGWDPANDQNNDRFVDDNEFANLKNPGATARFAYQARYPYGENPRYYGRRWILYISNQDVKTWNSVWVLYLINSQTPKYDGVFEDNAFLDRGTSNPLWEYANDAEWAQANREILTILNNVVGENILMINVGNYGGSLVNSYGQLVDLLFFETWIDPDFDWSIVESRIKDVSDRATKLGIPTYVEATKNHDVDISEDRNRIYCLANYYLMAYNLPNVHTSYYYGSRGWRHDDHSVYNWYGAIEYNVGIPTGDYFVWAQGTDPDDSSKTYKIFGRKYSNALILHKPRSYGNWTPGGISDATATTHNLAGTYYLINADGTLGEPITQITLRNAEGAILIKTPSTLTGDVNQDGKVDIKDLILVAKDFGKTTGFNPGCDINKDGKVDIKDLIIVAKNFGKR